MINNVQLRWTRPIWLLIFIAHLYVSGMWLGMAPRTNMSKKKHVLIKRDWIACSEYDIHPRLNSQRNWGGPMTINERIFTFIMNKISKNHEETYYGLGFELAKHHSLIMCFAS